MDDYEAYKALFEKGVDCYIINTGSFMGQDIPPHVTLGSIENNVENKNGFKAFDNIQELEYLPIEGYEVPFEDLDYRKELKKNMEVRVNALRDTLAKAEAPNDLPTEIADSIQKIVDKI